MPRKKKAKKKSSVRRKAKDIFDEFKQGFGKVIESSDISQITDAILMGSLACLGFYAFGDFKGAIWGPVALKLAQSENIVAGGSGVAGLAALGLAASPDLIAAVKDTMDEYGLWWVSPASWPWYAEELYDTLRYAVSMFCPWFIPLIPERP